MMKRHKTEDLEDYAYRYIIHQIVENQFRPGDTILETEMAKILNVSRTPVRAAIAKLINEGFLEKKRKKGCIIPHPQPEGARQVFLARGVLESTIAGLAAVNRTEPDLAKLYKILDQEKKALESEQKD